MSQNLRKPSPRLSAVSAEHDVAVHSAPRRAGDPYLPGEIIENKYRLVRPLGEGGMGTVWMGHNVVLDVHVAIKLINLREGKNSRSSERLLQEARAAARLGHPAIVRVFDFGRTRRGDPFVVMELIRGITLAEQVRREQRLPAIRAVQLMLPIADALSVAHAKGIIHRDVKPDNVILAADEAGRIQPKLLDFGIASMVETNKRLTIEGTVLGTPDYMSPEQARGLNDLDHRTDVWSFSVMLYELLTGRLPFTGANYNALLWSIIHEEVKPITEYAAGDKQLWRVLERGLKRPVDERWETIRVMGEALALWLYERGVREDVCAASLKTSWLDAGLGGVRIEVSSVAPGQDDSAREHSARLGLHSTPRPPPPDEPGTESGFFETVERPPENFTPHTTGPLAAFLPSKRAAFLPSKRSARLALIGVAGLALGIFVVWLVHAFQHSPSPPAPTATKEPSSVSAHEHPISSPPAAVVTAAPPASARVEGTAAMAHVDAKALFAQTPAPKKRASGEAAPAAPAPANAGPAGGEPVSRTSHETEPMKPKPRETSAASSKEPDFGF